MTQLVTIHGGQKLKGTVELIPNKNSFLPALSASILASEPITYHNVPETSDIKIILELISLLGGQVTRDFAKSTVVINCQDVTTSTVPLLDGKAIRASLLFAGPLLARFGAATIPLPGGCKLGHRGIAAHVENFMKIGITAQFEKNSVIFTDTQTDRNGDTYKIFSREASVTATENIILYAAGKNMTLVLSGAAAEPHVVDMLTLLNDMGAKSSGAGTSEITIKGMDARDITSAAFTSRFDFVDFCGYAIAAAVTDGEIRIKNANDPSTISVIIDWLALFQIDFKTDGDDIIVKRKSSDGLFIDHHGSFPMAGPRLPKLYPRPWPGFPVDCIPMMIPLAAMMKRGQLLIKNWMYEDGLQVTRELAQMGASIFIASPERIVINAKDSNFDGTNTLTPPYVIQSVKAVFLAALASDAGSKTTITNFDLLNRRYPDLIEKFTSLGAIIAVENSENSQ